MQDIKVTIIQSDIYWENIKKNIDSFSKKIETINEKTDLIVLPEMFNTGFTMNVNRYHELMNGRTCRWMREIAINKKCAITGSLIIKENENFYNRLIWINPDGTTQFYDKHHLFRMAGENENYTEGNKTIIGNINNFNFLPLICYDLRFPIWSRNKYSHTHDTYRYDCLVYMANWPEKRSDAWKTLLTARAIENQSYVIGVNRIGKDYNNHDYKGESLIISPKGKILNNPSENAESIETVTLPYSELDDFRKSFFVAKDWDKFKVFTKDEIEEHRIHKKLRYQKRNSIWAKLRRRKILITIIIVFSLILSAALLTLNGKKYQPNYDKYKIGKAIKDGRVVNTKDNLPH
ncbi:MAG: amidohydrolase [Bacteroidota bacterium]|nr:amidohydrolase [Bacteroidota bacterium]